MSKAFPPPSKSPTIETWRCTRRSDEDVYRRIQSQRRIQELERAVVRPPYRVFPSVSLLSTMFTIPLWPDEVIFVRSIGKIGKNERERERKGVEDWWFLGGRNRQERFSVARRKVAMGDEAICKASCNRARGYPVSVPVLSNVWGPLVDP